MPQALLVALGVVFVAAFFFVVGRVRSSHAGDADAAINSWKRAEKIGELISLYLDMAIKYGPKSREASSFRFGVANSELWGGERNSEALATFDQIVEHFDSALVRNKKSFRWK